MSHQPRVTVCVPTVNRPAFLREALASLAAQTWRDFEVLVADNSGDAECQRVIDGVLAEFPGLRLVLHRHQRHLDMIDNFNFMIDAARTELWACLPDDDRFRPNFLARSVAALDQHPECSFTFADHWVIRSDGTVADEESARISSMFNRADLREGVFKHVELFGLALRQALCLQTTVFRRPVIAALHLAPGIMVGDHCLFLRLGAAPEKFDGYYIDERLFEYRVHGEQISSTTKKKDRLRAYIASYESVPEVPVAHVRDFNDRLSRCYLQLSILEAEDGEGRAARSHAATSVKLNPSLRNGVGAFFVGVAPFAVGRLRRLRRLAGDRKHR